ncbi:MAG: hypothetical protein DMD90_08150 [Candidatus Rokuibacteriota bacterium]|nr:MAG: hypothetical protein DMD90_08150 [Candidatus Rokubacteria bacterium]
MQGVDRLSLYRSGSCPRPWRTAPPPHPDPLPHVLIIGRELTSRSTKMPTVGQSSDRSAAWSCRLAKSGACTIAMSGGRPDPAQPVRHARARPVRPLAALP